MLEDVLATAAPVRGASTRILVVTPDAEVARRLPRPRGASVLRERAPRGLNAAVPPASRDAARAAAHRRRWCCPPTFRSSPRTSCASLARTARRGIGAAPRVTLVPSADGDGTNALLLAPPEALAPALRPGQLPAPSRAGRRAAARPAGAAAAGLAADIDEPRDLASCSRLPADARALRLPRALRDGAEHRRGAASRRHEPMNGVPASRNALAAAAAGRTLSRNEAMALAHCDDLAALTRAGRAALPRRPWHPVTFSKKVFIPLTHLCRDVCHYCTFAQAPRTRRAGLSVARCGARHRPRAGRPPAARRRCSRSATSPSCATPPRARRSPRSAADSTLAYLEASAALVLQETGLLPHLNPGVMDEAWLARLRKVSVSQGIMLETASDRLSQRGGPHFGSPDKVPAVRLATLEAAGRARVPFTTGILIGIGETRAERIEALLAIRDVHERHGHIQEVIIQNFRAKPGTRMAAAPEPSLEDHVWTIAVARLIFGPAMNIQAPPNLQPAGLAQLIRAGINDWGGVSPVTPDHVNPEAPWPHLARPGARHRSRRPHPGRAPRRLSRICSLLSRLPASRRRVCDTTQRLGVRGRSTCPRRTRHGGTACAHGSTPRSSHPRCATSIPPASPARMPGRPAAWSRCRRPGGARARARKRRRQPAIAAHPRPRRGRRSTSARADIVALFDARGRRLRRRLPGRRPPARSAQSATPSPTSSTATSTTPTSAPTAASSAPSPRAATTSATATSPTTSSSHEIAQRTTRGLAARRHRGLPAGRHPSRLHRRHLPRHRRRREVGRARHARARLLAAGDLARRRDARPRRSPTTSRG